MQLDALWSESQFGANPQQAKPQWQQSKEAPISMWDLPPSQPPTSLPSNPSLALEQLNQASAQEKQKELHQKQLKEAEREQKKKREQEEKQAKKEADEKRKEEQRKQVCFTVKRSLVVWLTVAGL